MKLFRAKRGSLIGLGLLLALLLVLPAAAGEPSVSVQVASYADTIRFTAQGTKVVQMRLEVFNLAGWRLYDSQYRLQTALDWPLIDERGERVADGVYLYVVSLKGEGAYC
jgi:hypothetical protein